MNSSIRWKSEYNIGIQEVDHQHKELFKMLAKLEESLQKGSENSIVGLILKELVEYTQTHFKDEEKFMKQIGYWELDRHAILHKNLINEVKSILIAINNDRDYTTRDLIAFLKHWIVDHIKQEDVKFGEFYRQNKTTKGGFKETSSR